MEEAPSEGRFALEKTAKFAVFSMKDPSSKSEKKDSTSGPKIKAEKEMTEKLPAGIEIGMPSTKRRDYMIEIEKKVQEAWSASGAFEADAEPGRRKFMVTFPYPYMNGRLHLGHAFSLTKAEFTAGYKRLQGYNVLFPFGFHCTGMPIQAAANKLKYEVNTYGDPPAFPDNDDTPSEKKKIHNDSTQAQIAALAKKGKGKKAKVQSKSAGTAYQWDALVKMDIPESQISAFADPRKWLSYFPPLGVSDLKVFGASIDWRRSFITTDINAYYDSFVRWQFRRLKEAQKINFGKRANVYSVKDGQVCADHDRASGEGVGPQEYVLIKLELLHPFPPALNKCKRLHKRKIFLIPATLRPETMYGQTNCYVLPSGDYGCFEQANGDIFICSARAALGLAHQGAFDIENNNMFLPYAKKLGSIPESILNFKGSEILGAKLKAPLTKYDCIYVLPLETISMTKGTGVVTSVPSDAPDDWIALYELKNDAKLRAKYNLEAYMVEPFDVIPVINVTVPGEGGWSSDVSAEYWCKQLDIKSSIKDAIKLKQAKAETYLHGFNNGIMIIGPHRGVKVSEAKLRVKAELIAAGQALLYFEPESAVISRSGEECIVAHTDQWYLKYGSDDWRSEVEKHVDTVFEAYNAENLARFKYTLGWMKEWACSRLFGLGTKIPWDEQWVIESLSDSTIYMAYYTIAKVLQGIDNLDGTKSNDLPAELLTDEVWNYIFLTKPDDQSVVVPKVMQTNQKYLQAINIMRSEFRYWYPMDLRVSGKDLITNHLTMCLYNHAAIWNEEPELWPRSMYCNGFVLLDGEKMSKSTGNFLMLEEACRLFSTDAVRFALADAGDTLEDANFSRKRAEATVSMLFVEEEFSKKVCERRDIELRDDEKTINYFMDKAFANEIQKLANDATEHFDAMRWRDGILAGTIGLQNARDAYREWCAKTNIPMRYDLLRTFIQFQAILIAPICPHFAEHIWVNILKNHHALGGKGKGTLRDPQGVWPRNLNVDLGISRAFHFLQKSIRSLRLDALRDAKKDKSINAAYIYVTSKYPQWKLSTLAFMRNACQNNKLIDKKSLLSSLKSAPDSPCFHPEYKSQTKFIMQFASFQWDYADEIGLDALDDDLPFDQKYVLEDSKSYLQNSLIPNLVLDLQIFDLAVDPDAPGPEKKKQNATPGRPIIYAFHSTKK